jgi:hypothetical protein
MVERERERDKQREREKILIISLLIRILIPYHGGSTFMTSPKLSHLSKHLHTILLEVMVSTYELGGKYKHAICNTRCMKELNSKDTYHNN